MLNLQNLNPEQFKAVTQIEGAILIIAGAGSGKTRVITYRIAKMLDSGIPQNQILALTFTNKAASEMQKRVKDLTQKKLQNLTISTFHSFGVKILRKEISALGMRENFSIYDETDKKSLIKESANELKFSSENLDLYKISNLFSDIKTERKNWNSENEIYKELYDSYQTGLKIFNAVDFDDLIVLPIKIFREFPQILSRYREKFKYIMVDEFQDTSRKQYEMMKLLAQKNVAVVGDDDQSIYSWRGADFQNILNFEQDFPNVCEIRLEQNYRSTGTILAAANGVIRHNENRKQKSLWSGKTSGKPIEIYLSQNENDEAEFIAQTIRTISFEEHLKYGDFGVLIRSNSQTRPIEEAFLQENLPYSVSGGTSFFALKEIKDVISYLRVVANQSDDVNLLRIINTPRRGLGRTAIESLGNLAKKAGVSLWVAIKNLCAYQNEDLLFSQNNDEEKISEKLLATINLSEKSIFALEEFCKIIENAKNLLSGKDLSKKVRALLDEINFRDFLLAEYQKNEKLARAKLLNVESLLASMETWEMRSQIDGDSKTLFDYLNRITLLSHDENDGEEDRGKVNLMTIHAAKGLEFPVVFIAGAENGLIPHARAIEEGGDAALEEERRLFYVAITRAREKLFISSCQKRKKIQQMLDCQVSPFLDEIPQELIEYHETPKEESAESVMNFLSSMQKKFSLRKVPGF